MHHTELLNKLIARFGFTSYLEIGVQDGKNFRAINCPFKVGVDPDPKSAATHKMTSEQYWHTYSDKFDLIFVDGLHEKDVAYGDIFLGSCVLNRGGIIVVHDINPFTEVMQSVPRETREWTGDVWKAWMEFRQGDGYEMVALPDDYGIGIIRVGDFPAFHPSLPLTYANLAANRKEWLNLISVEEFEQWLKQG